jgi:hypothetical protein
MYDLVMSPKTGSTPRLAVTRNETWTSEIFTLEQAMKTQMESRGIALLLL